jgi:hypothetical protein
MSQERIIYDLDTYKRVNIDLRTTFFTPDVYFNYNKTLNNPSLVKNYIFNIGGQYSDNHLINDAKNQVTKNNYVSLGIISGSNKNIHLTYNYDINNRSYDEEKYFKNGLDIRLNTDYSDGNNSFLRFSQLFNVRYDIGFGFGRLEVVNNAWVGARILEELNSKGLLQFKPRGEEMKLFFDLIGDVEFERVMDSRLYFMNRVEKIIKFIEHKEWIDKGDIEAFISIFDTYSYEDFFIRYTGERLEFTLTPFVKGKYTWTNNSIFAEQKYIDPGFEGSIEYQLHTNGDLEYYQTKILGGRITHFQRFDDIENPDYKSIAAALYFLYQYRYVPSVRTNLLFATSFSGGIDYANSYNAEISANTSVTYNYYFSPSTQVVISAGLIYNDNRFQIGDYQPNINGTFRFYVRHAIR